MEVDKKIGLIIRHYLKYTDDVKQLQGIEKILTDLDSATLDSILEDLNLD